MTGINEHGEFESDDGPKFMDLGPWGPVVITQRLSGRVCPVCGEGVLAGRKGIYCSETCKRRAQWARRRLKKKEMRANA